MVQPRPFRYVLWTRSALIYSMLHLSGYKVTLDDLKSFRQIDSVTPGHPEFGLTDGIDATSGPLGQGLAQAVGMAMAERMVNKLYTFGDDVCNHYTYVLCGDGCLHEGVSQEAISLAGHQKLNKLIVLYDANQVTLDGALDLSFSEDVMGRLLPVDGMSSKLKTAMISSTSMLQLPKLKLAKINQR